MISTKFIKSSLLIAIGNALPLLSGIVLLPFYINLLSPDLFAELAIYISITLLAQLVFGLGIEAYMSVAPIKLKNDELLLNRGISSLFTVTLLIGVVLIALSYVGGNYLFQYIFSTDFSFFPYGFLSIITAFCNNFFKLHNNYLLSQDKVGEYFRANVINFFATIVISLIGLYSYQNSLWGPILGRLLSGVIIFLLSFWGFVRYYKFQLNKAFLKTAFEFALPMFIFFVFNWAMNYYDRIIIENNMPLADLAVYDFATKCSLPLEFLQNGLFAAISPLIYKIWKEQNVAESTPEVNRYFNGYSAIFLILAPLACLFAAIAVPFIVQKEIYYQSFSYLGLIAVGYCFKAYYFIYYIVVLYHNKTKVMPLVYLILATIQIALMYLAVTNFGIMGIIFSSLFVKMIQPMVLAFFCKDVFVFHFNKTKIIYLPLFFLGVVLLSHYFSNHYSVYTLYSIQLIVALVAVYALYKNELLFVFEKYTKKKK